MLMKNKNTYVGHLEIHKQDFRGQICMSVEEKILLSLTSPLTVFFNAARLKCKKSCIAAVRSKVGTPSKIINICCSMSTFCTANFSHLYLFKIKLLQFVFGGKFSYLWFAWTCFWWLVMVIFFPYSKNILQVAILFYLKSQVGFLHFLTNSHSQGFSK